MPDAETVAQLAEAKLVHYLVEAHAAELTHAHVLAAHIAMTPAGRYRTSLEAHQRETRSHAKRLLANLEARDRMPSPLQAGYGLAQDVTGQMLAMTKFPIDVARGTSGEEKLLKNAKEQCAAEALEIATYTAIEQLSAEIGDAQTEQLAASIRADEEQMLERLLAEIPRLATDVYSAEAEGRSRFRLLRTGYADAARTVAATAALTVSRSTGRLARRTRKATDVATPAARSTARRTTGKSTVRTAAPKKRKPAASTRRTAKSATSPASRRG